MEARLAAKVTREEHGKRVANPCCKYYEVVTDMVKLARSLRYVGVSDISVGSSHRVAGYKRTRYTVVHIIVYTGSI